MQKILYFIIVIVIIAGGYYFYAQSNKQAVAPSESSEFLTQNESGGANQAVETAVSPSQTADPAPVAEAEAGNETESIYPSGEEEQVPAGPDILVVQVEYDGEKFTPQSVNITQGDIVIFKNDSSKSFWPASGNHPTHALYPEFDPKASVEAGSKWQFKFEEAGLWVYHDHLNSSVSGTVNVSAR